MKLDTGRIAGITAYLNAILLKCREVDEVQECSYRMVFRDTLEAAGFSPVGSGTFRAAFTHPAVPGVIFKVQLAWNGKDSMAATEYELYHNIATYFDRTKLAECYHYSGAVCVMEFLKGRALENISRGEDYKDIFYKEYNSDLLSKHYWDAGTHNLVLTDDGRVILFDYAVNSNFW